MESDSVRQLLARHWPDLDVRALRPLGGGLENRTYDVNGELVVRVARIPDPETSRREAGILEAVRAVTEIAVPEPILVEPDAGLMVYRRLPGTPLAGLPQPRRVGRGAVAALLRFMRDIREVGTTHVDVQPADEWLAGARGDYESVAASVPEAHRAAIEAFLARSPEIREPEPVFCHNDLGTEHVLVDPDTREVTGIIDWTDAAMADPAYDLGLLYRDLGPQVKPSEAAVFYARCAVLEDLRYGVEESRETYRNNALAALDWLFTDG
jgi:aminoglycoside phosphotransferase (APT) family kinase protein